MLPNPESATCSLWTQRASEPSRAPLYHFCSLPSRPRNDGGALPATVLTSEERSGCEVTPSQATNSPFATCFQLPLT